MPWPARSVYNVIEAPKPLTHHTNCVCGEAINKGLCEISKLMITAAIGAPVVCINSLECYQKSEWGNEEVMGCISLLAAMCGAGVAW